MEETYSDFYAFLGEDPKAVDYFKHLPGYIQAQIMARKHRPGTYEELVQAADEALKVF